MRTEFVTDEEGDGAITGIRVVLSRRNIEGLLAKLNGHPPDSALTLVGPTMYFPTIVTVEENDVHYEHQSREGTPPGRLHPDSEMYTE